jgi:hypothetical protein
MYLKKRTVEVCSNLTEPRLGGSRKNLAVHVSLSSNLHNVKELTPNPLARQASVEVLTSEFTRTEPYFRLPGSKPALSDFVNSGSR